ncbi:MAG TPA: NAD-binding protein [Solirubrobacteraceae bacterium]|nr:NAD-binding protein [Solirubrobacteraceae bacterium]
MAAPILLIGDGDLAEEVWRGLEALDAEVVRLPHPTERELSSAFERGPVHRAVVVSRDDAFALRMALMVRDASADTELLVTIFDPTTGAALEDQLEHCSVTSMADIVAPALAGPCLDESLGAVRMDGDMPVGVRTDGGAVHEEPIELPRRRRSEALLRALLTPYDKSAALMFFGAIGLSVVLLLETTGGVIVLGQSVIDAFYGSAKTLVTVDPNDKVVGGPGWFKLFISISMLCALVFEAFFTAGLVNRLIDRRLTGLVGRRAVPRRDHVVVVGVGQVGLRLCLLLRRCGIGVVAVDDREEGENVGQAREAGLPVVIGRGADPSLLQRLSLERAFALAAVTDDDLENVSIAMASKSVCPDLRVVLRVGDGRLANETRSLFRFGLVRDVHRIAAALIAARATGSSASHVVCREDEAHLVHDDGRVEKAALAAAA